MTVGATVGAVTVTAGAARRGAQLAAGPLRGAADAAGHVVDRFGPRRWQRRVWARRGHAHIEVRGIDEEGCEELCEDVERRLSRLKGVRWAQVNAVLGRVVVVFDPGGPTLEDLVGVVEAVERRHRKAETLFPADRPEHPADAEPLRRNVIALGADSLALGMSFFGQLLQLTPLPSEVASVIALVDNEPRIRAALERRLGRPTTELGLGLANAFAQAVCQGPLGLTVDITHRVNVITELQAQRRCWERAEPRLTRSPCDEAIGPVRKSPRPVPLPPGPFDRYADRAALASVAGFAGSLLLTRSPRRSAAFLLASLPKAARHGREAYGSHLGRELARRDILLLDGTVLGRLDHVDTVVLDAAVVQDRSGAGAHARPLVDEARAAGFRVLVAGGGTTLASELGAERSVAGGARLAASVRRIQRDGGAVLLVAGSGGEQGLQAADCAVGVLDPDPDSPPPWAADVLTGPGLGGARLVVRATDVARRVSRDSAYLALGGSAVSGLWSVAGPAFTAARRASVPMNVAALIAQVRGVLGAAELVRRPMPEARRDAPWHEMDADEVLGLLDSRREGLSEEEAGGRRVERRREPSVAKKVASAVRAELANPLTPILAAGAGLSAAVGSVSDAGLVAGVTAVNAVIGATQRLRADMSIAKLAEVSDAVVEVVRAGTPTSVDRTELAPGDVVSLDAGDVVPADCRVLWSSGCEVDESILTGESLPVTKRAEPAPRAALGDRNCMLYDGTTVSSGCVLGVVVAVGDDTEVGRTLAAAPEPPPSGVEARLSKLTAATLPATVLAGGAVIGMGLLRGRSPRRVVSSGVGLTVASVPEGLPLLATTAQQAAARRLASRGAMVRNPRTIEALGRVDTLCFDKTGTLTLGEINLQRVSDGDVDQRLDELSPAMRAVLAAALRACPGKGEDIDELPHATDRAVVAGAARAGVGPEEGVGSWSVLGELAFDPARGFHAVVGSCPKGAKLCVKGAPEVVLPRCTVWLDPDGNDVAVEDGVRRRLDEEVERLAGRGLRVLAVAERNASTRPELDEDRVQKLELLGFVALADTVRPTAANAVADLRAAGVDVVMVTGDHPQTAAAIARELDILNGHRVVSGADLEEMSDEVLHGVITDVSVFARVTPTDKVRIVEALQRAGRIVAMTGDGANDAPAIRLAHTGIALGSRGTAPAREAADLVVVDDRMETILEAIAEGRAMWAAVRDALAILVGGNLGEVGFSVATAAMTGASPLGARQFLLVNLMTDMVPAIAVAVRPPRRTTPAALLAEGPDRSLGSALAGQIALRAGATAGGATAAWLAARLTGRSRRASTVALAALVGTQLGQTAVVGRDSPLVLAATALSGAALFTVVQTPGVSQFFGCTPLGPVGWTIAASSAAAATGASVLAPVVAGFRRSSSALSSGDGGVQVVDARGHRADGARAIDVQTLNGHG
jgi:cation-transporting ATPase I